MNKTRERIKLLEFEVQKNKDYADTKIDKIMRQLKNDNRDYLDRIEQLKQLEALINE